MNFKIMLGVIAVVASAADLRGAGFSEHFESGLGSWMILNQVPNAPPAEAAPADPKGLSLHIQDGATQRISRSFDLTGAARMCLEYDFYQNSAISNQRWFGGVAQDASNPLSNGAMARLGANDAATYRLHYYKSGAQSLDTGIAHAVGWHHVKLTLDFTLKQIRWQLDDHPPSNIPNADLLEPDAVVLGPSANNGTAGGSDNSVYYDNVSITACPAEGAPPTITDALSIKTHTGQGDFNVDLWNAGFSTGAVENRNGGPTRVVVKFDTSIERVTNTLADVQVTHGSLGTLSVSGDTLSVTLGGAADGSVLGMTFPGIAALGSPAAVNTQTLCLRSLAGDATNDGYANIFDLVLVRNALNTAAAAGTFRNDVNTDGSINIFDLVSVRNNLNKSITGACP